MKTGGSKSSSVYPNGSAMPLINEPVIPNIGRFWKDFLTSPAHVPPTNPSDSSNEAISKYLEKLCEKFLHSTNETSAVGKRVNAETNEYGLESPLTPPQSLNLSDSVNSIGEIFTGRNLWSICRCERDDPERCTRRTQGKGSDDWYSGHCGLRVIRSKPYSFIHINLSRKLNNFKKFCDVFFSILYEKKIPFRPIPGDSGTTVVLVTSDLEHEKDIRRILRQPFIRLDHGIRIFRISNDINANKDKYVDR
jgi:hypothetical protein